MPLSVHSNPQQNNLSPWIGRFAPSPTGLLHLGSLAAAIASYMVAKAKKGQWLVRIEDIDRPREVVGSAKSILNALEEFGLFWDGEVVYQSQRNAIYQRRLQELVEKNLVYQCSCSRKQIEARSARGYDGFCRDKNLLEKNNNATRIKFSNGFEFFDDQILGRCQFDSFVDKQDFIVKRRDGLFAYQLAVVADDIEQGVNHLVRGKDILDSTPRQNFLYYCFQKKPPLYYHIPLILNSEGNKLSKQEGSLPLDKKSVVPLLLKVFRHLDQTIDDQMRYATAEEIICHFEKHWQTPKKFDLNRID